MKYCGKRNNSIIFSIENEIANINGYNVITEVLDVDNNQLREIAINLVEKEEVADIAILIGEKKTQPIKEGLLTSGFDKNKIVVFNDVRDAYPYISNLALNEEVYALFENDLPDTYNEN